MLFAAIFALFTTFGFLSDMLTGGSRSWAHLTVNVLFSGGMAVLFVALMLRNKRLFWPLIACQIAAGVLIDRYFVLLVPEAAVRLPEGMQGRFIFDGLATMAGVLLGYAAVAAFLTREGANYLRMETEIALARDIHRGLVPPLGGQRGAFEYAAVSHPSGEVGGDLVDAVDVSPSRWVGYVADVTGHGVHAGVVMAMVKSAARMALARGAGIEDLLRDLNTVLVPLTSSAMFVTAAVIETEGDRVRFALAGHLPLLHLIASEGRVERLSVPNLPLGLVANTEYTARVVHCAPGDILATVTDGLTEVFDARDRELGLDGVAAVLARAGGEPLDAALRAIVDAARTHGTQIDDQSALLFRWTRQR